MFILDASVTMAWCFEDEKTPYSEGVLDTLGKTQAVVPTLWQLEVANVLLVGERRQRLTQAQTTRPSGWFGSATSHTRRTATHCGKPHGCSFARGLGAGLYR